MAGRGGPGGGHRGVDAAGHSGEHAESGHRVRGYAAAVGGRLRFRSHVELVTQNGETVLTLTAMNLLRARDSG